MPFSDCIYVSVDWCNQKTASLYTYQSSSNNKTLNARLLAQVCHRSYIIAANISRLMQSENGILLLSYIFLSHGNEKKMEKGG